MINYLRTLASEVYPRVEEALGRDLLSQMRGVLVGVDRFFVESVKQRVLRHALPVWDNDSIWSSMLLPSDINWADPPCWPRYGYWPRGHSPDTSPFYFLVVVRDRILLAREGLPSRIGNHRILYQYRPECTGLSVLDLLRSLSTAAGLKVQSNSVVSVGRTDPSTAGTLGGIIESSRTGKKLGISCEHVLGPAGTEIFHPGPFEGKHSSRIGCVVCADLPPPLPELQRGNPRKGGPSGKLDVAVTDLDEAPASKIGQTLGEAPYAWRSGKDMLLHDPVSFVGKVIGKQDARISHLCIWYEVRIDGHLRCFEDVFEISHRKHLYVNTPIARPGDSGAWIVASCENLLLWDGLLFAGDGAHGFCCFADNIVEFAERQGLAGLTLNPMVAA